MITGKEELEGWPEREKILPHMSSTERIAACEGFDSHLVPSSALLSLLGGDQARAAQHGKLGWMTAALAVGEGIHAGDDGIVGQDPGQCVDEHSLAIAAIAISEKQRMFRDIPEQAITSHALQETD